MTAMHGTVKWFNPVKGYGFIEPEDGGRDVFVHITAVQDGDIRILKEGMRIAFERGEDKSGRPAAINLSLPH